MTIWRYFFRYFEMNHLKIFLMLCNRFYWTLCKLFSPLLPSGSQDWVFNVIIGVLGPLQIFNNFSFDFFPSFKLLYLYKKYPQHIIKICIPYNLIHFFNTWYCFGDINTFIWISWKWLQKNSWKNMFSSHYEEIDYNISHKPCWRFMKCVYLSISW